jgi:hypothetical protein
MKNLFLSVVLVLTVSFSFANNSIGNETIVETESNVEISNILELISNDISSTESYSVSKSYTDALGCLLKFTFIFEDGSSTVRYYYTSQSCDEFFE